MSPIRPRPYCSTPGCRRRATHRGKCEEHRRRPPHQQGYDEEWGRLRREYLEENPWCEEEGCISRAVVVDHKDGTGPQGNNDWSNLQALCWSHHSAKTGRQLGFGY